ncbi:hypothetical protein SNEBB_005461 [Seison nebaliae]|nr:hypothetical protein SNEBB_005461 [Seison nebaliae]
MLNVREASTKQVLENNEVSSLCKILGLQYKSKYDNRDDLKSLRYGRLMIMSDQDHDGSHIKGLVINFIHNSWPNLLKHNFIEEFITPIVKVSRRNTELSFFSIPEFEEWKNETENWPQWKVKYYKGLGTSTSKEAKEYFSDMQRHRIRFLYEGIKDDDSIRLAFEKKMVEQRKHWLTAFMEEKKQRKIDSLPEVYLYEKDTTVVNYTDFVHRELVHFSNADNERSIPNLMDGLKPGQRKILFTVIKRNLVKELKVAQLAGSVAELSAYHHGEQSLMSTIINLAQDFVGTNNLNILSPIGQFGTRLQGGKDSASPRYIFTRMSTYTRALFHPSDDPILNYLDDDGMPIEPEWYCPIIPTILCNGAEGIGTGFSTKLPNYNPKDIIGNVRRMLRKEEPVPMVPWYRGFYGTTEKLSDQVFINFGRIALLDSNTYEITELPVGVWTQTYKEHVLEPMLNGTEKTPIYLKDYKEYHTDTTVRFVVKILPEKMIEIMNQNIYKFFKITKPINISNMVLFDAYGMLKKFSTETEIFQSFFSKRFEMYQVRKEYLIGFYTAQSLRLDNIARFILEKISGKLKVENIKKVEMLKILARSGYDADPIKIWKDLLIKKGKGVRDNENNNEEEDQSEGDMGIVDRNGHKITSQEYNYLLGMPLWNLTKEKKEEILKEQKEKLQQLEVIRKKTITNLWEDDLTNLEECLEKFEKLQKEEEQAHLKKQKGKRGGKSKGASKEETKPSIFGEEVKPDIKVLQEALVKKPKKPKVEKVDKNQPSLSNLIKMKTEKEILSSDNGEVGSSNIENIVTNSQVREEVSPKGKKTTKKTKTTKTKVVKEKPIQKLKAKRRRVDDDFSSDESVVEFVDDNPNPTRSLRTTTKKTQYILSSDDDLIIDNDVILSD